MSFWSKATSFVDNAIGAVGDVGQGVINGVVDAGKSLDEVVRDTIPGGWVTVGLIGGGYSLMNAADAAAAEATGQGTALASAGAATDPTVSAIQSYLSANPGLTSEQIAQAANQYGVTASQLSQATGVPLANVEAALSGTGLNATTAGNLAEMGGGQGLVSNATTTNLASMGGGQGLTTAGTGLTAGALGAGGTALSGLTSGLASDATANAALGAGGAGVTSNTLAGNLGTTGLAAGTGSLLGSGAASTPIAALGAGNLVNSGSNLNDALLVGAGANLVSGVVGANAAKDAAATQAAAADKAIAQQQANFETINKQQAPYRAAGYGALNNIGSLGSGTYQMYDENGNPIGKGQGSGYLQHQFNTQDLYSGLAPNYDFMLKQGQMANQRMGNVAGGALSGNTLQGLNKFSQDYAGNAYQNAFNNYQQQRQNIYNTLAGIAGIGQTGQTATNNAATNATNAATQLGVGSAAAQAAGTIGQTNAYTNALNNVVNSYTLASLLNQGGRVGP